VEWEAMLTKAVTYDEEDGDFVFTRASKRTKTAAISKEPPQVTQTGPVAKKTRTEWERDKEVISTAKKTRAAKQDVATPKAEADTISVPKRRRSARLSGEKVSRDGEISREAGKDATELDSIDVVGGRANEESSTSFVNSGDHATMITLPFSDTPVINRNKELRKKGNGSRRSSLAMRGRRASSLIESGHSALPHREVETHEFYKHIEAEGLTEPRRMKQLLTWVGERALGDKPSHGKDSAAELAGKVFKFARL
jgi:kinetochore protein Mis13/DSN1